MLQLARRLVQKVGRLAQRGGRVDQRSIAVIIGRILN